MNIRTYEERVKKLIGNLYYPGSVESHDVKMSTPEIYSNLCTVIPATAFDQHDLVNWLEDLGFEPQYQAKEDIKFREVKGQKDENGEPLMEKDVEEYDDLRYYWYMQKIS